MNDFNQFWNGKAAYNSRKASKKSVNTKKTNIDESYSLNSSTTVQDIMFRGLLDSRLSSINSLLAKFDKVQERYDEILKKYSEITNNNKKKKLFVF